MRYLYKTINETGELVTGVKDAPDKLSLIRDLKKDGKNLISITEAKSGLLRSINEKFSDLTTHVKAQDKIIFAKNLGAMIEAGLPMARAIEVLERQTKNKKFKKIIEGLGDEIRKGKTLSESMALSPKIFTQLFISMVKAGEESGSIAQSLGIVSQQMEKSNVLQKKIRGAMMYPMIIMIVMIGIGILMMIYVVPTLVETFKSVDVSLPWTTQLIISISDLFRYHYLLLGLSIIILAVIYSIGSKSKIGRRTIDTLWIKTPVVGNLVKEINAARTARTLSALLSSGVDMLMAIDITESVVQNSYFKEVIVKAKKVIQNGESISGVFLENQNLYPSFVGEMMSVGEETGKLAPMLMDVAIYYETEVDQRTKDMSTIIEPVLMVIIGAAVGFFAVAMISPTYSVLNNIK